MQKGWLSDEESLIVFFALRFFWRTLDAGKKTLYATDNSGTCFKKGVIDPGPILADCPETDGINTPNIYIGSYDTYSALHLEDLDLYSYNIVIFGADKAFYILLFH